MVFCLNHARPCRALLKFSLFQASKNPFAAFIIAVGDEVQAWQAWRHLADSPQVVAPEVHDHQVLGPVLLRGHQSVRSCLVSFWVVRMPLGGALDGPSFQPAVLARDHVHLRAALQRSGSRAAAHRPGVDVHRAHHDIRRPTPGLDSSDIVGRGGRWVERCDRLRIGWAVLDRRNAKIGRDPILTGWVSRDSGLIYGLGDWNEENLPPSGGTIKLERNGTQYNVTIETPDAGTFLTARRVDELESLRDSTRKLSLYELLGRLVGALDEGQGSRTHRPVEEGEVRRRFRPREHRIALVEGGRGAHRAERSRRGVGN